MRRNVILQMHAEIDFPKLCAETNVAMAEFVHSFTTPISIASSHTEGRHHGTGNYFRNPNGMFLMTNEHVARAAKTEQLTHMFRGNENIYRIRSDFLCKPAPIDIAVAHISPSVWSYSPHQAMSIDMGSFDASHRPVDGELLFIAGYSRERSRFGFGTLVTPGLPYLTQEKKGSTSCADSSFDMRYHFVLHYNPEKAVSLREGDRGLPVPDGFSGSLVWNTKRIEALQTGNEWTPEMARVSGIIWGWSADELIGTKVECFRQAIADVKLE